MSKYDKLILFPILAFLPRASKLISIKSAFLGIFTSYSDQFPSELITK